MLCTVFHDVDSTQRPMRSAWFSVGFYGSTPFNMILSNSAAHLDLLRGFNERGPDSEKYHLLALQSITRRLAQPDLEVTDELIGGVAGFICHNVFLLCQPLFLHTKYLQSIVGNFEELSLHLNGIEKLVELRGGLDALSKIQLRETLSWYVLRYYFCAFC
jgi:hypothetical protein